MKNSFYLLLILTLVFCQEVEIDKVIESIAKTDLLETETICFDNKSEKYKNFLSLHELQREERFLMNLFGQIDRD